MARFVSGMGGTTWGNIATQYYQSNYMETIRRSETRAAVGGPVARQHHAIHDNLSPIDLARAKQHERCNSFTRRPSRFNFVIATPQKFNDAASIKTILRVARLHDARWLSRSAAGHRVHEHALCAECGWRMREGLCQSHAHGDS